MIYKRVQSRKTAIIPLNLLHLGSMLECEYEIRILDSTLEGFENEVEQENGLNCYGLSDESYRKIFAEYKPDVVGISCLFSSLHRQMLRAARLAKEVNPEVITVVGGPHPSALPGLILQEPVIDFCVIGEGEKPLASLLDCIGNGKNYRNLEGIGFRDGEQIRLNNSFNEVLDLDQLPFPAWHLIDLERYFKISSVQGLRMDGKDRTALRLIPVTTSRGCPFSCTYCGKYSVWGNHIRFMSPKRVMEMLEILFDKYSVQRIAFQDDNLTLNRKRALDLFRCMAERNWPLTWEAHNGLALSSMDEKMIDAMVESGCVSFTVAIESGSKEVLKKIKKRVDLDRAFELAQYAKSLGIDMRAFYIIGFPGETRKQIEATRAHMRKMQTSVSALAIYTPLPGSPLYQELVEQGVLNSEKLDFESLTFGAFDIQLSELSVTELNRIRKIDWLMKVFADTEGNLKLDIPMNKETTLLEIKNGLELYPNSTKLKKLYEQI
jgi:magnesium-protoporphyrin IX monomethyl ester (oxidative) cyclase